MSKINKYVLNKYNCETSGQLSFFGRDNVNFKSINMPRKQRFINICKKFKLKKIVSNKILKLELIILK